MRQDILYIPQVLVHELLEHARTSLPYECVGLLFGHQASARQRVPVPNVAPLPETRYAAEPEALLAAFQTADKQGDDLVAIYHSHPNGPHIPSVTDLQEAHYDVPYLIVVPEGSVVRGFTLRQETYREIVLIVTQNASRHHELLPKAGRRPQS